VKAEIEALPLEGEKMERTFHQDSKKSIGQVMYVELKHDPKVSNPWRVHSIEVQAGSRLLRSTAS
jgi:hypothetical protein